jgi:hypothetical protein
MPTKLELLRSVVTEELPEETQDAMLQAYFFGRHQPPQPLPPQAASEPPAKPKKPRAYDRGGLHASLRRYLNKFPNGPVLLAKVVDEMRFIGKVRRAEPDQTVLNALKKSPITFHEPEPGMWMLKKFVKRDED